ncbi:delta-1-pyrroline-5-carboxylate synthase-like isoform X1 [Gossypium australe]|uniref:Delta-1-pyrroline-5-carboxylate synthase n=1 Tax=Gossypium australe TaxID=47621 RepID=A0A5B6V6V9_9ROSI|nr:delta-1-pyrroline-5-carboxylate synthase-like isoform X1 [Gossypium australe]
MDPSRAFVTNVKRLIVKVGTAVVTRGDGRLAVGRLGALCEQLKELNSQGYEIVLVTSGAVGLGLQRLRYRKLVNSSLADLQNAQFELDGKACAAVGQSSLMALYDTLFSQLDVTSSQYLVTDTEFRDTSFRKQLSETVKSLLSLKVIPIFNENDAVSTRRAPYEDSSGIFWDNDSLAGLLAMELKADLLVMLSDVEGLYSGPPSDPNSKLIHTYIKEKHQCEITFGDKSRLGRGGMTAKVNAAVCAAYAGIPSVITSGYATDNIIKVLQGKCVGTLFHRDAHLWTLVKELGVREMAVTARECSRRLQAMNSEDRRKILLNIADALEANESLIKIENEADVTAAQDDGYEKSLISHIRSCEINSCTCRHGRSYRPSFKENRGYKILEKRLRNASIYVLNLTLSTAFVPACRWTHLGEIIFSSRCTVGCIRVSTRCSCSASLAIRSGNGLLLKGGKEAKRSNAILHKVITSAIPENIGEKLIGLLDDVIDLVIPRGSNKLVTQIKNSTKIPVLGHADGICHVYVDKSAKVDMAKQIVRDAKIDYPAACNAMETLLLHKDLSSNGLLNELVSDLRHEGVTLYGGPRASSFSHTDCIITENHEVAETFLHGVDSAAVFHNASTRFCDGARFGLGAEVGISTNRIHARGPVGVEGLILRGSGQVVDGDKGVTYTHKDLPLQTPL